MTADRARPAPASTVRATFTDALVPAEESLGALLVRLRTAHGWSQLRLAELLCAGSGNASVTRHEVSRWEREERVPTSYWLGWLALVFDLPVDAARRAAAVARSRRRQRTKATPVTGSLVNTDRTGQHGADFAAELGTAQAAPLSTERMLALAHQWLIIEPSGSGVDVHPTPAVTTEADEITIELERSLTRLRRLDDLVGGTDLYPTVRRELKRGVDAAALRPCRGAPGRRLLRVVGGLAQLAGWVAFDAGLLRNARQHYTAGFRMAQAAGDTPLAAYLLSSLSFAMACAGQTRCAVTLARTAEVGGRHAPGAVRALLAHRVAWAYAAGGEEAGCRRALERAEQASDQGSDERPEWLYWLDSTELAAMSGRCHAVLGRAHLALPLLRRGARDGGGRGDTAQRTGQHRGEIQPGAQPRTTALYTGWLAQAHLDAGDIDQACAAARDALVWTISAGSARGTARLSALRDRATQLGVHHAAEAFDHAFTQAASFLPANLSGR